ncbi:MAG TPA: N-acetylmuramic acid 6-phosphate etherase [Bryobacteraceae bacterium]|jgi:N-acetylmuramic acid 6-phosphate etherase|nr:N-acetylmuramic acid 6-phosphate etherase [Bryobacteraceae bacterium]
MLERLLTEQPHPAATRLDQLATGDLIRLMNEADAEIAAAVAREIPQIARAIDAVAEVLKNGGSLVYIGAGTSGRLGVLDASECPPTFNVPPALVRGLIAGGDRALTQSVEAAEDDPAAGGRDLDAAGFTSKDALIGISASGRTPYVLGAIRRARELGSVTGGISCTPDSELSRLVDFPIEPAPGPEILTGSTRLRAGTATKMVLNMISTGVMIRLGHVYGNLMVNVQPTNKKLEDRARRIIAQAANVSYERATALLDSAGRSVRTAIVMEKRGVSRERAEQMLAAARGNIGKALEMNG